jgi:uncharacterized protein (TIGR02284 family)
MITNDDKALLVLKNLIRAGRDAEQGFLAAADSVPDPELVQVFAEFAVQRAKFVVELQDRVRTLRGDPEQAGTIGGEVHRAWLGLRAAIASNEIHAILAECERGEDMAVTMYRYALAERDVDPETRDIVQRQYEAVQAAHDRIRQLRDSATYAHR